MVAESRCVRKVFLPDNVVSTALGMATALVSQVPPRDRLLGPISSCELVGRNVTLLVLPVPELPTPELIYIMLLDVSNLLNTSGRQL